MRSPAFRGLAAIAGLLSAAIAGVVGVILAFFFAATVVTIGIIAAVVLAFAALAVRARKWLRKDAAPARDDGVIEAQRVGGHSWVAYGWENRR